MKIKFPFLLVGTLFCLSSAQEQLPRILDETVVTKVLEDFQVNENIGQCDKASANIAVDGNGNYVIAWMDYRNGPPDIYCQRYSSNGVALGPNSKVNDDTGSSIQYAPAIDMNSAGSFVIVWNDERSGSDAIYCQRYDSNGNAIGANVKLIDGTQNVSDYPCTVGMDNTGNFVLVWRNRRGDIYCQRYDYTGAVLGLNLKVNDATSIQEDPDIGVTSNGDFMIVWTDRRNNYNYDIYCQRYNNSGAAIGVNFKVNDDAGTSPQHYPTIGIDGSGNFAVAWEDHRSGSGDIYCQRYDNNGATLGTNFKINDDARNAIQYRPAIDMDSSGNFVVVWKEYYAGFDIYYQRYDKNGTALMTNFKINDDVGNSDQDYPVIGVNGNGVFVVAWRDNRSGYDDIYCQRYNNTGTMLGTNFRVTDDTGSSWQEEPTIGVDGNGGFVLAWVDRRDGEEAIYCQRYDGSNSAIGTNFKVYDDPEASWQIMPAIGVDSIGNFVVVWLDYPNYRLNIYCQRYDRNGTPLGSSFKVNGDTSFVHPYEPPAISVDRSGNFVVAWAASKDIYCQRYESNGIALGPNFRVNDDNIGSPKMNAVIGTDDDGNFVVAWWDYRNGPGGDIFCQRYDHNGIALGANLKVNDDVWEIAQNNPAIGVDSSGNFVIVWEDGRNGNADIYGQRYDSNGNALGANFRINNDAGNSYQDFPTIGVEKQGYFVVVWEDFRNKAAEIYGQLFDNSGNAIGSNYRINSETGINVQVEPDVKLVDQTIYYTWKDNRVLGQGYDIFARVDLFNVVGEDRLAPQITHTPIALAHSGQNVEIAATAFDNISIQSATLYYRQGGATSFQSTPMNNSGGGNYAATIPADFVTERGLEYYISVQDPSNNTATYPATDASTHPQVVLVRSDNLTRAAQTPVMAYRMISVPMELKNASPRNVLEDDWGNYNDTQWRLLRYVSGEDREYTVHNNFDNFDAGKGFWLITRNARTIAAGAGLSVTTAQNFVITLQPGWNQVGNPFAFPVNWSEVIKSGNVESKLVGYQGALNEASGYDYTRTRLEPWEGYFVNNLGSAPATIEIPSRAAREPLPKFGSMLTGMNLQENEWALRLSVASDRYIDKDNYLGCLSGASEEWDRNDFSEAPFFDKHVALYFPHHDWATFPGRYTGDFRPVCSNGQSWDFQVQTNMPESKIKLELAEVSNLPTGWSLTLLDEHSHIAIDLLKQVGYTFLLNGEGLSRSFRLLAGPQDFIGAHDQDFSSTPTAFELSPNYPNPFNPETKIGYTLPTMSHVRIIVFNSTGQQIRTLVDHRQSAGRYAVSWNGTNDGGESVASGIYLLRMEAGDFVTLRKMVLAR